MTPDQKFESYSGMSLLADEMKIGSIKPFSIVRDVVPVYSIGCDEPYRMEIRSDWRVQYQQNPCGGVTEFVFGIRLQDQLLSTSALQPTTIYMHPDTWNYMVVDFHETESFSQMWEAYKEAGSKNDGFRGALGIILEDQHPEPDVWFITPHDLRSSRTEKAIGFQSGRSGWSDYEED